MKFQKLSLQGKIYISCFILNIILLFISSLVFYYFTTNALKENMEDSLINNTTMLNRNLDSLLKTADNSLKELQTNDALLTVAKNIESSSDNYFIKDVPANGSFKNTFGTVLYSQDFSGSISYVSRYYDHIGVRSWEGAIPFVDKEFLKNQSELPYLFETITYASFMPPHEEFWGGSQTVFSVIRSMRDTRNQYGLLILDFDSATIADLLKGFENPSDYSITILDGEGTLVYTSDTALDRELFYSCYEKASREARESTFSHSATSLSCFEISPLTGWTFILSTSTVSYLQSLRYLFVISTLLFLSLFAVMSAFLYLATHRLTRPLRELSNQLKNLESGGNISPPPSSENDEVTILAHAVQGFLKEIYDQNQRLAEASQRTLKAHYNAMEAQLNPHFLYNTLSVIGMAGLNSGNAAVATMCGELANLLRYSLSYNGQSVRLEQEISNAANYLYIMKMRYEEDLNYKWTLDESLNTIRVPKLILQPLMENCFRHGFLFTGQEMPPPWQIRIRSYRDDTRWYLAVSNNGLPFREEKLAHLNQKRQQFTFSETQEQSLPDMDNRQGFGLENTILRLNIYYRGKEFFKADSSDSWTTVTIGGPLQ